MFSTVFLALALECSPGVQEAREIVAMVRRLNADTLRGAQETRDRINEVRQRQGLPPLPPVPVPPLRRPAPPRNVGPELPPAGPELPPVRLPPLLPPPAPPKR
jgi:hypothetical protein